MQRDYRQPAHAPGQGFLEFRKGFHNLTVRPGGKLNGSLMDLRAVRVTPASDQERSKAPDR
jgi:hypothetical protein